MRFEVSERIPTNAKKEELLLAIEEQFRKVSNSVQRHGDKIFVKSVEATFGSINRNDDSVVELQKANDGWLAIASVHYRPSVAFWIFLILSLFTAVFWLLPIAFYLLHKKTVKSGIQDVFLRIRNEFQGSSGGTRSDNASSDIEQIEQLAALKDKGIITEEEYTKKKKDILGL